MYQSFAKIYDTFMQERVNYKAWSSFVENIVQQHDFSEKARIVDYGCGTGSLLIELEKLGYKNLLGIDASSEMLDVFQDKCKDNAVEIEHRHQDMREATQEISDVVLTFFDTMNYLPGKKALKALVSKVHSELSFGGIWVFDIITQALLDSLFGLSAMVENSDNYTLIWELEESKKRRITIRNSFFLKESDECYRKYEEIHEKVIFSKKCIEKILVEAGFDVEIMQEDSIAGPRYFFIARKIKEI